jgi:hypothetical protein
MRGAAACASDQGAQDDVFRFVGHARNSIGGALDEQEACPFAQISRGRDMSITAILARADEVIE